MNMFGFPSSSGKHRPSERTSGHRHHHKNEKSDRGDRGDKNDKKRGKEPQKDRRKNETQQQGPCITFLFVVVRLAVLEHNGYREADRWGNMIPPKDPGGYDIGGEVQSSVWRYQDGCVQNVSLDYEWRRDVNMGMHGSIYRREPTEQYTIDAHNYNTTYGSLGTRFQGAEMESYNTLTVFDCGRFLPRIWAAGDASVDDIEINTSWRLISFRYDTEYQNVLEPGVTRIGFGPGFGQRCVSGRNPSWMPGLVPSIFRAHQQTERSRGLGGSIGILLGLMALANPGNDPNNVFQYLWNQYQWRGDAIERDDPELPRGYVVQVSLDDENPDSTTENLDWFEAYGIAVRG